jgi:hypothetical protein
VFTSLLVEDCAFSGGGIAFDGYATSDLVFQNNLFDSVFGSYPNMPQTEFYNNLFLRGALYFLTTNAGNCILRDNAFDEVDLLATVASTNSHNAFIAMTGRLYPTNVNDKVLSSFSYGSGPLGRYYQVSIDLYNAGSRTAEAAGLYQQTVKLDQTKERESTVDIGLHYAVVSAAVAPDRDGDGISDADEIFLGMNPALTDTDGDGVADGQDAFPLDPARSSTPAFNPSDTTAPTITLEEPVNTTLLP